MTTRRTATALAISLAALMAAPGAAFARPVASPLAHRPAPTRVLMDLSRPEDAASYLRQARGRLYRARLRIYRALRTRAVPRATQQQIFHDLAEGTRLIRQRIAWVAADGQVTAFERGQVESLVGAIAKDMTGTYGAVDSWQLM